MREFEKLPVEIQEKMMEHQVEQGNKRNSYVFKNDISCGKIGGGFYWGSTLEGRNFWRKIIVDKNFTEFYKRYPKKDTIQENKLEKATRNNSGKPKWHLMDMPSFEPMIRALEWGAERYGEFNWQKGLSVIETLDSLQRHFIAFQNGQDIDEESGKSTLGHLACNVMFLLWTMQNKPEWDDRKKILT